MTTFEILAILLTLSAIFSYFNHRFLKLPTTIGLMGMALVLSLLLLAAGAEVPALPREAERMLASIDFNKTLLHGAYARTASIFAGSELAPRELLPASQCGAPATRSGACTCAGACAHTEPES